MTKRNEKGKFSSEPIPEFNNAVFTNSSERIGISGPERQTLYVDFTMEDRKKKEIKTTYRQVFKTNSFLYDLMLLMEKHAIKQQEGIMELEGLEVKKYEALKKIME